MSLNESYKKVNDEVLASIDKDVNKAVLSLQESATKIWQAVENDQQDKINTRAANTLISVFHVMRDLGIDNPEECLTERLEEFKNEK